MADTILNIKDGTGVPKTLAAKDGGIAGLTPYHAEDATQRSTLLAALSVLSTDAKLEAVRVLLAGSISVSGPLTSSQLTTAALATSAKQDALIAAVTATSSAIQPVSAAALPLPVGAATATKQDLLVTNTKALGQSTVSISNNVPALVSNSLILASNTNRKGGALVNDSTAILYLKLSSGASSTSYDYYLAGSVDGIPTQFEIPPGYIGPLYGYWSAADGYARVSERT